jgi:hypothetical protein
MPFNNLSDRRKFDDWYRTEHLPSALRAFQAQRAWRCWSRPNPLVHLALYEFPSVEEAEAMLDAGHDPHGKDFTVSRG